MMYFTAAPGMTRGRTSRRALLGAASGLVVGGLCLAAPTRAATTVPNDASVSEVVVTASRVERNGFTAPTPTTIESAADLEKTGATTLADLLNQLPAFGNSTTPATTTVSSQQAGGNYLNLRDLGSSRTLVLVDGQRHVPTTATGLIDTNVIPTLLIDRIEVVTGGASAAWGSDAVAGVVNIILKKKITGLLGAVSYGETQYSDFKDLNLGLASGTSFMDGRGHFMVGVEYSHDTGGPPGSNRSWINAGYQRYANPSYTPANGQTQYLISPNVTVSAATLGGLITGGPLKGTTFLPGGATGLFTYGSNVGANYMVGGSGTNLGVLYNNIATPLKRGSIFTRTSYNLTSKIEAYLQLSAAYSQTVYALDSSYDLGTITIQNTNAYLPASIKALMAANHVTSFPLGRINQDLGEYLINDANATYRGVAGLNGSFGGWTWKAYYEYGHTRYSSTISNNRINANFASAINAVVNPANGQIVCASTLINPTNGCVPINLFGAGSPSPAAISYVNGTQALVNQIDEQAAGLNIQGEPFKVWAGPVSVAAGFEYRYESDSQTVDPLSQASAFNIGNPKPLNGSYDVKEAYAETVVPILSGLPLVKSLDFDGAARITDYSSSGTVLTWKLGGTYAVNDDLKFRVTRSRDIRAPNLTELYASYVLTFATVTDPLNRNTQTQVQSPTEGNPSLKPEVADTLTYGVIVQPHWVRGLSASVDVYSIDVHNAISTLAAQDIINRCGLGTNASLCQYVVTNGAVLTRNSIVYRKYVNLTDLISNGVDFELDYRMPQPLLGGSLTMRTLVNFVGDLITNDGVTKVNHGGDVGADAGGLPHWRFNVNATYDHGPWTAFLQGRYVGGGPYDSTPTGTVTPNSVSAQFVVDASLTYRFNAQTLHPIEVYGVMNNILDTDPPVDPTSFIASFGTNKALYDIAGRRFKVGVRFKY